ncbi:MAG: phosphoenolpyruvate synthase [Methylotenera sp.]|nr:phosphoenolpyruvate synthase [Oligoflexia bacterium]
MSAQPRFFLDSRSSLADLTTTGGGKAKNLAKLTQLEIPVPEWFCISTTAFDAFAKLNGLDALIAAAAQVARGDLARYSADLETEFLKGKLPEELITALRSELQRIGPQNLLAVRSSGLDEDSADNSFAGQFSSYMFQRGEEQVFESLKKCWASGFSERALSYRIERKIDLSRIRVGVVIQKMVNASAAGVGFSRNPMKPLDRETLILSSVWGLGEGLVSGELDADHFEVNRSTLAAHSQLVPKEFALRQGNRGGLRKEAVAPADQARSSLSDAQIQELAKTCMLLEEKLGSPQDCEWAYEADRLYLLQTRPITSLPPESFYSAAINGEDAILWDNSNIIESFCGVTSPLTFSHVSRAYRQVYLQFCEVMGVPEDLVSSHESTFRNMLGLIRGRIYYNLGSWYQLLFLFPGTSSSKSFMETMMGVKQGLKPEIAKLFDFTKNPPKYSAWKKTRLIVLTILRIFRIQKIIHDFKTEVGAIDAVARKQDFEALSFQKQMDYYHYLEKEILYRWKAPIISDTRCMVFFGLLKALTQKWLAPKAGMASDIGASLQNDLLCGQGDLASTEPTRALMKIAGKIDLGNAEVRSWMLKTSPQEIWKQLKVGKPPEYDQIRALFQDFLDKYGFRCMNELKFEEIDLHEDPSFAIEAVLGFVRLKNYSIEAMETREKAIRQKAEAVMRAHLSGPKLWFYEFILDKARIAVRDREDLRFMRTNSFGVTRRIFRAMGVNLHKLGVLEHPRDVFYLTMDEMMAFNEGRSLTLNFKPLVAIRKAEFAEYERTPSPPDRFITQGIAGMYLRSPQILAEVDLLKSDLVVSDDPNVLLGTSCCPGVVEGIVRVIRVPADAEGLNGEIIVTERTDPGWVPLFPSSSGLLIERGSLLSHSAVVARELGIPTIVGISGGLLKKLKSGMRVRMDAGRGEVRFLTDEKGNPLPVSKVAEPQAAQANQEALT